MGTAEAEAGPPQGADQRRRRSFLLRRSIRTCSGPGGSRTAGWGGRPPSTRGSGSWWVRTGGGTWGAICWPGRSGRPPRWRWGGKGDAEAGAGRRGRRRGRGRWRWGWRRTAPPWSTTIPATSRVTTGANGARWSGTGAGLGTGTGTGTSGRATGRRGARTRTRTRTPPLPPPPP